MATIIDSYSETNQNDIGGLFSGAVTDAQAQSFTVSVAGYTLYSAKFYLKYSTSIATVDMTAKLYAHSGTFGAAGSVPTGTALATSDVMSTSVLTTSLALYEFLFTGAQQYALVNGTHYFISLEASLSSGELDIGININTANHAGRTVQRNSGTWNDTAWDTVFYVYGLSVPGVTELIDARPFHPGLKLYP